MFTEIGDAIREKRGHEKTMTFDEMPPEIRKINNRLDDTFVVVGNGTDTINVSDVTGSPYLYAVEINSNITVTNDFGRDVFLFGGHTTANGNYDTSCIIRIEDGYCPKIDKSGLSSDYNEDTYVLTLKTTDGSVFYNGANYNVHITYHW